MMYLKMDSTSIEYGKAVAQMLYRISKPDLTGCVTQYIGSVIQHPETKQVAVELSNSKYLISPYSGRVIDTIFDTYARQYLTPKRNTQYRKWLKRLSGKSVYLARVISVMKEFRANFLSEEQAYIDGWLIRDEGEEEVLPTKEPVKKKPVVGKKYEKIRQRPKNPNSKRKGKSFNRQMVLS